MKDEDWNDAVDFGHWIVFKTYCNECGKIIGYSCLPPREYRECVKAIFHCEECVMKVAGGVPPIEDYYFRKAVSK